MSEHTHINMNGSNNGYQLYVLYLLECTLYRAASYVRFPTYVCTEPDTRIEKKQKTKSSTLEIISVHLCVLFSSFILCYLWVIAARTLIFGWTATLDFLCFFFLLPSGFIAILLSNLFGICLSQNGWKTGWI